VIGNAGDGGISQPLHAPAVSHVAAVGTAYYYYCLTQLPLGHIRA
jgi:hypothetical protein